MIASKSDVALLIRTNAEGLFMYKTFLPFMQHTKDVNRRRSEEIKENERVMSQLRCVHLFS